MVRGWFYPKVKRNDDDSQEVKAPNLLKMLGKNRWVTEVEAELHYISETLGSLRKEGFLFAFAEPFTDWPEWYLDSVMSHVSYKNFARLEYEFEQHTGTNPADYWSEETKKEKQKTNGKILNGLASLMKGVKFNGKVQP